MARIISKVAVMKFGVAVILQGSSCFFCHICKEQNCYIISFELSFILVKAFHILLFGGGFMK